MSRWLTRGTRLFWIAGGALCALGLLAHLGDGLAFTAGPIKVSARDPWRLYMEGGLALAFACMLAPWPRPGRGRAMTGVVMSLLFVALVMESSPRRVGDGHQYLAMARQLSLGRPPGLLSSEVAEAEAWLGGLPGFGPVRLGQPGLVGGDGRQDMVHFWLYPLLVAPWLRVAGWMGAHPNHAFTAVNLVLMAIATIAATERLPTAPALLLVAGPLVWWLDKAHAEVFTVCLLMAAMCWLVSRPIVALALFGAAAAQNPALVPPLTLAVFYVWWTTGGGDRRAWLGGAAAFGLAGLHPAYYLWHIGVTSPLASTFAPTAPGVTAMLTPLLDLDLGLVVHFPGLAAAVALCLVPPRAWSDIRARWPAVGLMVLALVALLVAFAQTPNVNHGGTPGPSRYGLWLIPLAVPTFVFFLGTSRAGLRRGPILAIVAACSMTWSAFAYHPKLAEALHDDHTAVASWVFERWPALYAPLPEVFAERTLGYDGSATLPVATPRCEKVLLAGDGSETARWPLPCGPVPIPPECRPEGTLCYANRSGAGYRFALAPRQPTFAFALDRATSWTPADASAWRKWLGDWDALRGVKPWSEASFIRDASGVVRARAWQNDSELLLWMSPAPSARPRVLVRPPFRSATWWLDAGSPPPPPGPPDGTIDGETWIDAPTGGPRLLVVRPSPRQSGPAQP